MCILSSQLRKPLTHVVRIHLLVLHERAGCIAATKLMDSGDSHWQRSLQTVRHLKCIAGQCIKSFEPKKGVRANPFEPPRLLCILYVYFKVFGKLCTLIVALLNVQSVILTTTGKMSAIVLELLGRDGSECFLTVSVINLNI